MNKPGFWNNLTRAKSINKRVTAIKEKLSKVNRMNEIVENVETYGELLEIDFSQDLLIEASENMTEYKNFIDKFRLELLLGEETDSCGAIIVIHPGAGGTESQDWAEMLLRMYSRWAEKAKYKTNIVDLLPGDEAGIKSVTMEIIGQNAFGKLKGEVGIHRLVRISPFNAQGKRQTSFSSVFVYPIIDDDIEVDIKQKDLKIDTYRASGAGGQHINKTDSAVRITHLPTGIVVQCQNERSQLKNREMAMKILKSRIYKKLEDEKNLERQKIESNKSEIGWGNQIRSYVFHPYQMVKDHRTNFEIGNSNGVMDGNIDGFIEAYLKYYVMNKKGK
jgi:peptide chain release factor 2